MNEKKTEFIMFGNKRQLVKCTTKEITKGEVVIQRTKVMKLHGVKLDKNPSYKDNLTKKCGNTTLNLHKIRKMRNSLDDKNTKNLIYALATSLTDYCSSLIMGVQENTLQLVEKIQNTSAKLMVNMESMTVVQMQNANYTGYYQGRELTLNVYVLFINDYMEMLHIKTN